MRGPYCPLFPFATDKIMLVDHHHQQSMPMDEKDKIRGSLRFLFVSTEVLAAAQESRLSSLAACLLTGEGGWKVVMMDVLYFYQYHLELAKPYRLKISAEATYTGNLDALHRPGFITIQFNTLSATRGLPWPLMRDISSFRSRSNICPEGSFGGSDGKWLAGVGGLRSFFPIGCRENMQNPSTGNGFSNWQTDRDRNRTRQLN